VSAKAEKGFCFGVSMAAGGAQPWCLLTTDEADARSNCQYLNSNTMD